MLKNMPGHSYQKVSKTSIAVSQRKAERSPEKNGGMYTGKFPSILPARVRQSHREECLTESFGTDYWSRKRRARTSLTREGFCSGLMGDHLAYETEVFQGPQLS